ncbi:sensor histidine kinase [Pseudomaricurvus hydrocarbonicus]
MCSLQAVFLLVLLGELLALALTLADSGLGRFDWEGLGLRSFLMQWIVLLSAALLCPLRFRLSRLPAWLAGALCYLLVLGVTLLCSGLGLWGVDGWQDDDLDTLLGNLLLAAIFAGVVLRYLYVQQQWSNQQKAELSARLQALQSRIQPHFLFNSMNSIASLIATRPELAERLVEDLSSLFRASLAEPGLVALADELDLCHQYLEIEKTRLGDRLQVRWRVDPVLGEGSIPCRIPSLLLQPLLENAIQHGIQPLPEGGLVTIDVGLQGEQLTLGVTNPVPGKVTETAFGHSGASINSPDTATGSSGNRIALDNIRHRLQAYFGDAASFSAQFETFEAESADVESDAELHCFVVRLSYPVSFL